TVGTVGSVSISATIAVTASAVATFNSTFYVAGEETANEATYSAAGAVSIANVSSADGSFAIIAGEQDYNDGAGVTSNQPSGDFITGGSVVFTDGVGGATLTLITNNPNVGVSGTETFALAFTSPNHALITQFDGSATSSGSFDIQSAIAPPVSTGFAFSASGADSSGAPTAQAGVFLLDASSNLTGTVDTNDAGTVTLATAFPVAPATVTLGGTDSLGRGAVTGSITGTTALNYYVVGPEVLRIINVDTTDTAVGSAYGQGAATGLFTAASIGTSAFLVAGNDVGVYAAAGQFNTDGVSAFSGVLDENESVLGADVPVQAAAFTGTYTLAPGGNGLLTFTSATTNSVALLGVYAVDPTLNILDPNNPTGGGGALIAELDSLVGVGALIPQSVTTFGLAGPFTFGASGTGTAQVTSFDEFDFLGEATIAGGDFFTIGGSTSNAAFLSDPLGSLTGTVGVTDQLATFNTFFTDDGGGVGRSVTADFFVGDASVPPLFTPPPALLVTAYEANAGQAFWIDVDPLTDVFGGSLQANIGPAPFFAKRAQAKNKKH
ncbi:MAG: hypothetical protein WCD43_03730, partial [Candidatus Acidiferrales bacterium]